MVSIYNFLKRSVLGVKGTLTPKIAYLVKDLNKEIILTSPKKVGFLGSR